MLYYLVMASGLFMSYFNKRPLLYLFTFVLLFLSFFRYGIGADYFAYQYLFERLSESFINEFQFNKSDQEIGFRLIGVFLKGLGLPYQIYLSFFAVVNLLFVMRTTQKYSKNPTLCMVLYFCLYYLVWTFSGIRQGLVLAIGIYYLLGAIKNNKVKRFFVITLLLSTIHLSAFFLIFLYLVMKINFKKKHLYLITISSLAISFIPLADIVSKLTWLPLFNEFSVYIHDQGSFFNFKNFGRIVFLMIAFFFYSKYAEEGEFSKKVMNAYIIGVSMYFVLQFSELMAARLSIYGQYLNIIIFTNLLYLYKDKVRKLLYFSFLISFCFLFLFKNLISLEKQFEKKDGNPIITPYVNIYNKDQFIYESDWYYK